MDDCTNFYRLVGIHLANITIFVLYLLIFFVYVFKQLFDRITSTVVSPSRAPPGDAVARCRDVIESVSSVGGNKYLKDELMLVLASPHVQVCCK